MYISSQFSRSSIFPETKYFNGARCMWIVRVNCFLPPAPVSQGERGKNWFYMRFSIVAYNKKGIPFVFASFSVFQQPQFLQQSQLRLRRVIMSLFVFIHVMSLPARAQEGGSQQRIYKSYVCVCGMGTTLRCSGSRRHSGGFHFLLDPCAIQKPTLWQYTHTHTRIIYIYSKIYVCARAFNATA